MSEQGFIQGGVVVAIFVLFLTPVMITMFFPEENGGEFFDTRASEQTIDTLTQDYRNFTNTIGMTTEQPWCLTGIYTPYTGGAYNYTPDHWLYSTKLPTYSPSQYTWTTPDYLMDTTESAYKVKLYEDRDKASVYRYEVDPGTTTQDGHKNGDLYTYVTMDVAHQSDIFFTESLKKIRDGQFWYEYSGLRYAFQPLSDYYAPGSDGKPVKVSAVSTSLSLIWYNFAGSSGISGQLVLTGSDSGVAYITAGEIITAFNSVNNTAKFSMVFNSCEMNVYIRINPYYTSMGYSIEDCYNYGWWSIMVSSITTDTSAYTTPANPMNPEKIWETLLDLFTFNMDDYPMSKTMGIFASLLVSIVMYSTLLAIAAHNPKLLIIVAVIALIQTITSFLGGLDLEDAFSWWPPW